MRPWGRRITLRFVASRRPTPRPSASAHQRHPSLSARHGPPTRGGGRPRGIMLVHEKQITAMRGASKCLSRRAF